MTDLLATVERLGTRLGITLDAGTADHARAREALWSASTRARSIAQCTWTDAPVPDVVIDVVLAAAMRLFRNPDRLIVSQAGSFQAALPNSDMADGDVFLRAELAELRKNRPTGKAVWALSISREDGTHTEREETS